MRGSKFVTVLGLGMGLILAVASASFQQDSIGKHLVPLAHASEPIKIVFACWEGPEGSHGRTVGQWAKELEKRSGGRVKVEVAYGGAMGPTPEHYHLAATGVADAAEVGLPFTPGQFPMSEVMEMPINGHGLKAEDLSVVFYKLYEKGYLKKDFKDVVVLWVSTINPYDFQMRNVPVRRVKDLKGKKIRVTGKIHTEIAKLLGAIPVGMPGTEIYGALEKGITDGVFTDWSAVWTFRYEKLIKYVTKTHFGCMGFAFVMNRAKYESLPKDIQQIIAEMRPKYARLDGRNDDETAEMGKKLALDAGVQIIRLSEAEMERFSARLAPLWQKWIAEGEKRGLPRKKMLEDLYDILKGMGVKVPFIGYTP